MGYDETRNDAEVVVQSQTEDQSVSPIATAIDALGVPHEIEGADGPPAIPDAATRAREELSMLMLGFATGLSIAGVFLLYMVLEYAKLLP